MRVWMDVCMRAHTHTHTHTHTHRPQVTELAAAGELEVYVLAGRHLPHVDVGGSWAEDGDTWRPTHPTCNPYVVIEQVGGFGV